MNSKRDDDLNEEIATHLRMATADRVKAGESPSEAQAAARREFGNVGLVKEVTREMWGGAWLERVGQDFKYGWRQLRRTPSFTVAAVVTLALGIGATAAVFSVLYNVVLKPLPFRDGERIADFMEGVGAGQNNLTYGAYADWRVRSHSFVALGAYTWARYTLTGVGDPVFLSGWNASADYWRAVYSPPVMGRYFNADEDRPGAPHVVVLSYGLWSNRFASDPAILGKTISLSSVPYMVIGVASPSYNMGQKDPQLFTPWAEVWSKASDHSDHELQTFGLLKPGVTLPQAVADVEAIERANLPANPNSGFDGNVTGKYVKDELVDSAHGVIVLFGAVACVLLIGCVNIANLLLSRGAVRSTELAVRSAMGAGRGRVVLQLLNESLLLAGIGALAGIATSVVTVRLLLAMMPENLYLPRMTDASVNLPVIVFALLIGGASGILFGLMPAIRASRLDLQQTLRAGGRDGGGAKRDKLRSALVIVEVGLAQALLILAGLLIHSAIATSKIDPGIALQDRTAVNISLPIARYRSDTSRLAAFVALQQAVSAIPGVTSTAYISNLPLISAGSNCRSRPEGSIVGDQSNTSADFRSTSPNYFTTMGIRLTAGRDFGPSDATGAPPVAVINETMAKKFFGAENPIGKRVAICVGGTQDRPVWRQVIGVVADVRSSWDIREGAYNDVYMPMTQFLNSGMTMVVGSKAPQSELTRAIRERVRSIDPLLPIRTQSMDDAFSRFAAPSRFLAQLYAALAGLALTLSAIGIYGVIAYFVTQRTREIGLRMALGAQASRVIQMIVRQGLTLAVVGLAFGLIAALLGGKVLAGGLYGVSPRDPITFVGVSAVLLLVAVAATLVPARRATRIDPVSALRE